MGGFGSGNWYRSGKKSTVEKSLTITMRDFRGRLFPHTTGTLGWEWPGGRTASVGYIVSFQENMPIITLHYRWGDREDIRFSIRLQSTPTQFGGERLWFTCPLIFRGVPCERRVAKLYSPPAARYFGCRRCYDLTYQSCQWAHQSERMYWRIGFLNSRETA